MKAPPNSQSIAEILLNFEKNSEIGSKIGNKIGKLAVPVPVAIAMPMLSFDLTHVSALAHWHKILAMTSQKFEPPHLKNPIFSHLIINITKFNILQSYWFFSRIAK